ncbi:hypothetical protein NDU88_004926 [Pleurodeles waltl]|uniref:Uncharacterized protein n=1 Tax=Pleurodeles waltl TaxID=8319 RepID=A0AAV7PH57_PLEWA|nr:hypothetical protein NDU88_004926 [Pleurodeles waltl]
MRHIAMALLRPVLPIHDALKKDLVEWARAKEVRMHHIRRDDRLGDDLCAWSIMISELQESQDSPTSKDEQDGRGVSDGKCEP